MPETIVIPRQFRGPAESGNGGYTCGTIAGLVDAGGVEVTLRLPPPLDTRLAVERDGERVRIVHAGEVVAEARPAEPELEPPGAPSFAEAGELSAARPAEADHPFPGCFVCGTGRTAGDALCLRPAPLGDGRVVAPWHVQPQFADARFAWAALDCPGGWAVQADASRGISVLGRLTLRVHEPPAAGDRCVVVAWPLDEGPGRRRHAGTALYREEELLAIGRAVWFEMGPEARDRPPRR